MSAPRAALLLIVACLLAGCGGGDGDAGGTATTEAAGVQELDNVLQLRADFEADEGKARVLVLFSPT